MLLLIICRQKAKIVIEQERIKALASSVRGISYIVLIFKLFPVLFYYFNVTRWHEGTYTQKGSSLTTARVIEVKHIKRFKPNHLGA
jgi:hypothetical protein